MYENLIVLSNIHILQIKENIACLKILLIFIKRPEFKIIIEPPNYLVRSCIRVMDETDKDNGWMCESEQRVFMMF